MNNDRKKLIRLASSLPKGSDERRTLLAELQKQSMKVPNDILDDFLEMARGNGADEVYPNNEKVWVRNGNVDACPVCGSTNTAGSDFTRKRGGRSKCSNCGSEYRWSFKLIPDQILSVEFGAYRAPLSQYPTKGSWLEEEAVDWAKYPANVQAWKDRQ